MKLEGGSWNLLLGLPRGRPFFLAFPGPQAGSQIRNEQPQNKLEPIWDAGIVNNDITC